jgi:membrane-bound metal-dependent hydrolase YbcI (DUF457 family)
MDTLSHTLWGGGLFGFRGHMRLALLFGAMPDLVSFGLWLPERLMENGFQPGKPALASIPDWLFVSYDFSHSLLIAAVVVALVAGWRRDIAFAMLAWPFHILLDVPFHSADFFPTKILWPVSAWAYDGISWTNPWVWFANLAGLAVLWAWRWQRRSKRS